MRNKLIAIAVISCLGWLAADYQKHRKPARGETEEIDQPVYAELNVRVIIDGKALEEFVYVEAKDEADCDRARDKLEKDFAKSAAELHLPPSVKASRCLTALNRDQADLFANRPTSVTYLSLSRGTDEERETRVIVWGLTGEQSDRNCQRVQREDWTQRRGRMRCIQTLMV